MPRLALFALGRGNQLEHAVAEGDGGVEALAHPDQ